jgi:hypothetical protein
LNCFIDHPISPIIIKFVNVLVNHVDLEIDLSTSESPGDQIIAKMKIDSRTFESLIFGSIVSIDSTIIQNYQI